ncbi:MAG TPA: hypothetical protein VM680_19545 [Verrucomicrobiae bacterium]|nr:hypothetical protein [Verrucomicrobiae bacterium]
MIFPQLVSMAIALVPVVIIETIFAKRLINLPWKVVAKDISVANVWTTLLGVPIAWVIMLLVEILATRGHAWGMQSPVMMIASVTLQAAWLIPYEEHIFWMVPAALTFLLIPSFFISVWIERWVLRRKWRMLDRTLVGTVVLRANLLSYMCLFVLGCVWLLSSTR